MKQQQITTTFYPVNNMVTQVIYTYNRSTTKASHYNMPVDIIYLDYAKAFDKVPHPTST